MAEFSKEEVIKILQTDGELTLEGDNNINIHIIWRADRSIDTGDLYGIIEDLEDDGYEVIALIQDHIKRIRSVNNYNGDNNNNNNNRVVREEGQVRGRQYYPQGDDVVQLH